MTKHFACLCIAACLPILTASPLPAQTRPVPSTAPRTPQERVGLARDLVQQADRAMQAGDVPRAIDAYEQAIRTLDNDTETWLKLGDAHFALTYSDISRMNRARACWEQAVVKNPRLLPARRRLLEFWIDWANANTGRLRGEALVRVRASARDLLQLSSGDKRARWAAAWATLELWILGEKLDQPQLDAAMRELRKLQSEDPDNPEVHYAVARAQANRGLQALRRGELGEGNHYLDLAPKTIDHAARRHPNNATFAFRRVQLLLMIGPRVNPSATPEVRKQQTDEFNRLVYSLAERARAFSRPDEKEYEVIWVTAAMLAKRAGRLDAAEAIYRELLSTKPDSVLARVHLGELMRVDPKRLDEALAVLIEPRRGPPPIGIPGVVARDAERRALIAATDIRLEQYAELLEKSDDAAGPLLARIESDMQSIAAIEPQSARYLKLLGKRQLFGKEPGSAVQTLERALQVSPGPGERLHFEILFLLARAHQSAQQPAPAESRFREILQDMDYPPARYELARLLIARNALDDAREQLERLRTLFPDSGELKKLDALLKEKSEQPPDP